MSNPLSIFNDFVRANLPSGVSFDSDLSRYVVNGKRFVSYKEAIRYKEYLEKFGWQASGEVSDVTLSHNSVTASVSDVSSQGTYVDGTPWAVRSGSTQITATSLPSAQISRSHTPGDNEVSSPTTAWSHGLVRNPGAAPSGATLSEKQAVNNGIDNNSEQGWDELQVAGYTSDYDATKNIDPGKTGSPATGTAGVYVKAQSQLTGIDSAGHFATDRFSIFTLVATAPGATEFRPPAALGSWPGTPVTTDDINMAVFQNLSATGAPGTRPTAAQALDLLGFAMIEQDTFAVRAENVLDRPDTTSFGGDVNYASYRGTTNKLISEIILLLNYDLWSASEKEDITIRLVQMAIDIAGRAHAGGVWQDNGGHCLRKFIVAFAARVTGQLFFTEALAFTTTLYDNNGGGASSIWGDDRQVFDVTATEVAYDKKYPYVSSQIGWPEWSSAPLFDLVTLDSQYQNDLGVDPIVRDANATVRTTYRHIIASAAIPAALGLRMMGAVSTFNNSTWFDYQDRHMTLRVGRDAVLYPDGTDHDTNDVSRFALWSWAQHRAAQGGVWQPETYVAAILGQSQPGYLFETGSFYRQVTQPTLNYDPLMEVYNESSGTITQVTVNSTTVAAGSVNPAMASMSQLFTYAMPERTFVMADMSVGGTGRHELFDDADLDRSFTDLSDLVTQLETDHAAPDLIVESWMASDNSIAKTMPVNYSPALMGERWGGETFTLGNTNPDATNFGASIIDHCLWDVTAASSAKGRGVFTRDKTKWSPVGWPSQNANSATEINNFNDGATLDLVDAPARASMTELFGDSRVQEFAGYDGFSSHVALMTDGDTLDGTETSGVHPSVKSTDGQILMGWPYALSILRQAGLSIHEPRIIGVNANSPTDGSYIDIDVDLPNRGTLTTLRAFRGTADPVTPSAHQQDVVGFEIQRSGADRRPVFLTTETGKPVDHRGTVTIVHDGGSATGDFETGVGVVRITPTTPFAFGDSVEFLRGDGGAIILNGENTVNEIYLDQLIEHVPLLYDASATYPMEGIPVRPQPTTMDSVVPFVPTFTYADSEVTQDFSAAAWSASGFTKTVTSGWLIDPTGGYVRADTNAGAFSTPSGSTDITACYDIRDTSGGAGGTAYGRLIDATGTTKNGSFGITLPAGTKIESGFTSVTGVIDMGGGVWRVWVVMPAASVSSGDRIVFDIPSSDVTSDAEFDFSQPALFYATLSPADIENLGPAL